MAFIVFPLGPFLLYLYLLVCSKSLICCPVLLRERGLVWIWVYLQPVSGCGKHLDLKKNFVASFTFDPEISQAVFFSAFRCPQSNLMISNIHQTSSESRSLWRSLWLDGKRKRNSDELVSLSLCFLLWSACVFSAHELIGSMYGFFFYIPALLHMDCKRLITRQIQVLTFTFNDTLLNTELH